MSKYDESHGSPFDRGGADSYYNRPRNPHKWGKGERSGENFNLTPAEVEAYHAGYDENEKLGYKKAY